MFSFIYFVLVWLGAGFITGLTAFGGNLVAVPLITLSMPPKSAIVFGCLSGTAIFIALALIYRKNIIWQETALLVTASWFGGPLGLWFLAWAGSRALLLVAGGSILLFLLWQFLVNHLQKRKKPVSKSWAFPLGLLSGIMMGGVSMGGPPLALYAFLRRWDKETTLGTINAISIGVMLPLLPWQWHTDLLPLSLLIIGLVCGIAAFCGTLLSIPAANKLRTEIFRRLLLGMLALSSFVLLVRGILS